MIVLRLEHIAEQVAGIELDVARQEPKKGYEVYRKKLDDIIFELNEYLAKNVCTYLFLATTILDRVYKIQYYINEHE